MKHILSHVILILGKCLIKGSYRPDMTIAVDWDVKHHFKQTNEQSFLLVLVY